MELNIETKGKYSNTPITFASGSSIQPLDSFFIYTLLHFFSLIKQHTKTPIDYKHIYTEN